MGHLPREGLHTLQGRHLRSDRVADQRAGLHGASLWASDVGLNHQGQRLHDRAVDDDPVEAVA